MNLGAARRAVLSHRPEEVFGVLEEVPELREKTFKILARESLAPPAQLQDRYFNSYSGARDYLFANWPENEQAKWQILQAETREEELVMGI
jgi:hypothetical protein